MQLVDGTQLVLLVDGMQLVDFYIELFHMTSAKTGGGKTNELLCYKPQETFPVV